MKKLTTQVLSLIIMFGFIFSGINVKSVQAEEINPTSQSSSTASTAQVKKGLITVYSYDSTKHVPLRNTQYHLIDLHTNKVVETLTTNSIGIAVSNYYPIGSSYKLVETKKSEPYASDQIVHKIEIKQLTKFLMLPSHVQPYIKSYEINKGSVMIKQVNIPVNTIMQKPELPNGCEITSLTAVINSYNFHVTKMQMSNQYLPKQSFVWKNGKLYGPNPNKAFAGDPSEKSGFFSYAAPIVTAANNYFKAVNGKYHGVDISGSSQDAILNQLKQGYPVVIWITLELEKPKVTYGWYLSDTDKYFSAPVNLHCVVLTGFDEKKLYVMDPLKGQVTYDPTLFFNSYADLGRHAMIVVPN